jgi:hypothetical protein
MGVGPAAGLEDRFGELRDDVGMTVRVVLAAEIAAFDDERGDLAAGVGKDLRRRVYRSTR